MEFKMNVFTLNCWGIPILSKDRKLRMAAIAQYLVKSTHEVVCLQEVWSKEDFMFLKECLKFILPHSHYFYSGVIGSGLCIFSKWTILDVFFHQWPLNGYIHKIQHGDWFGGKGVGLCRIKRGDTLINIYCTHLHAEYDTDDIYLAHRVLQAYSTAEFIKLTSYAADISILAGDLNTAPGELSYRILTEVAMLADPYTVYPLAIAPSLKTYFTSDAANNTYANPVLVKTQPEGKRIDYIMYKYNENWKIETLKIENPLEDRIPGQNFSYSDHNAVAVELFFQPSGYRAKHGPINGQCSLHNTISETIQVCKEAIDAIHKSRAFYLTAGCILFMFLISTVGFWPNRVVFDVIKIIITGVCLYYVIMGTLWNQIELNSIKAGLTALENTRVKVHGRKEVHIEN